MWRLVAGAVLCTLACCTIASGEQRFVDHVYDSKVMAEPRHYRLFLPAGYQMSHTSYPVVFYFHGHSDRYTLKAYDKGLDTVDDISCLSTARKPGGGGGGSSVGRVVSEGEGNGNGILEPGERATICVRVCQGLNPSTRTTGVARRYTVSVVG